MPVNSTLPVIAPAPAAASTLVLTPPPTSFGIPAVSMDYSQFMAKGNASSVVMFCPEQDDRSVPGTFTFFESMRRLGHNIHATIFVPEFKQMVAELHPSIIGFSVLMPEVNIPLMREMRTLAPDAITIAGGFNMIADYAYGVDYVVMGSGGLIFPKMLNLLYKTIDRGGTEAAKPEKFGTKMQALFSERSIAGPDGRPFKLRVSLGERIVTSPPEFRLFELKSPRDLKRAYRNAVERWTPQYPDTPFPLKFEQFTKAVSPDPQGQEIDRLVTAGIWHKPIEKKRLVVVTSQMGCWGKCVYCPENAGFGNRGSVEHELSVIADVKRDIEEGRRPELTTYMFGSSQFIQNTHLLKELLDGIEAMGSYDENGKFVFPMNFRAQTRIDSRPYAELSELYLRMKKLGFQFNFGVEAIHPQRIIQLGKRADEAQARAYSEQAKKMIRLIAKTASESVERGGRGAGRIDLINTIIANYFDTPETFAEEMVIQMRLFKEIWDDYRVAMLGNFNAHHPTTHDALSARLSEDPASQIGPIAYRAKNMVNGVAEVGLPNMSGAYYSLRERMLGDEIVDLRGVFEPLAFNWEPRMYKLITGDLPFDNTQHPIAAYTVMLANLKSYLADMRERAEENKNLEATVRELDLLVQYMKEPMWATMNWNIGLSDEDAREHALHHKLLAGMAVLKGMTKHTLSIFKVDQLPRGSGEDGALAHIVFDKQMAGIDQLLGTDERLDAATQELIDAVKAFRARGGENVSEDTILVEKYKQLRATIKSLAKEHGFVKEKEEN